MKITITKRDIRLGEGARHGEHDPATGLPKVCPATLALSAALGQNVAIGDVIYVGDPPYPSKQLPLPPELAAWLVEFDAGGKVKPITFELNV